MLNNPVDTLQTYVNQPSGSHDCEDVAALAAIIAEDFASLGFAVESIPGKSFGPTLKCCYGHGPKQLLLMGHMDTVFPHDIFVPYTPQEGSIVKGSGICDMKGGIVVLLYALKQVLSQINPEEYTLCAVINPDEEAGSTDSHDVILNAAKESFAALSFEPSGLAGALTCSRKGVVSLEINCKGIPGHAGSRYKECASATQALCAHITKLYTLRDDEKDISFNLGVISGGTAENVVAEYATARCEFRFYDEALHAVLEQKIKDICAEIPVPGVTTTVTFGSSHPACDINEKSSSLLDLAMAIAAEQGRTITCEKSGGAGDIAIAALADIGVLDGFGLQGGKMHTTEEWADISSLPKQIALSAEMIRRLCQ